MFYNSVIGNIYSFLMFFGDWGLGIGDWAQSPIPNPQSPNIIYCSIFY